jgi:hypothetical protein
MSFPILRACLFVLLCNPCLRAEEKPAPDAPAKPADAQPGPALKEYKPDDLETLRTTIGQDVLLRGVVDHIGSTKTKTLLFVNFNADYKKTANLTLSSKGQDADKLKTDLEEKFKGKEVVAKGRITEFKGRLELKVASSADIQIATPAAEGK